MPGEKCSRTVQLLLPLSVLVTHRSSDQVIAFSTELYALQLQLKQTTFLPLKKTQQKHPKIHCSMDLSLKIQEKKHED